MSQIRMPFRKNSNGTLSPIRHLLTLKKGRPPSQKQDTHKPKSFKSLDPPVQEETKTEFEESKKQYEKRVLVERFSEIAKYYSSPLRKTAIYMCESQLVAFPNPYRIEYQRGGITTQYIRFSNVSLEPVFVRLYKVIPELDQLKFINLSFSRTIRIPTGLPFNLGFIYDDVNEKEPVNCKIIFVASRNTSTPCYQICEINSIVEAQKNRPVLR